MNTITTIITIAANGYADCNIIFFVGLLDRFSRASRRLRRLSGYGFGPANGIFCL